MDVLKAQLANIKEQLSGLTASQKMLAGAIVVIMVLTLMFWARYAGTAEMATILDQPFSSDEIARVTTKLASRGIRYQVQGDRILVPADRRFEVLADLSYDQLLPQDTQTGYDIIAKQMSPWDSSGKMAAMFNQAKQITLAQVIRNFPNVANATVVIDPKDEVRIGNPIAPTALVSVTLRSGTKADNKLVNAAADVVAGAVAGMPRKNVSVVIDGRSYPVADRSDEGLAVADSQFDLKYTAERKEEEKIRDHFSFIHGLIASVTIDLNIRSERSQETVVDPEKFLHKEVEVHSRNEENISAAGGSGEAGAVPNMGMEIESSGGGGGINSSVTDETTRFQLVTTQKTTNSMTPAGKATVVSASIRVPRSYFVQVYKAGQSSSDAEPTMAALSSVIESEISHMRDELKTIMMLKDDSAVSVAVYTDAAPQLAMAAQNVPGGGVPLALRDHVKEIAIGSFALLSLFMISMMVRKSSTAPIVPPAPVVELPQRLVAGEHLAGEAGEGDTMLDGMELDDDAVKAQQVIGQVSTLVKDDPDAAASLVKRWMNRV